MALKLSQLDGSDGFLLDGAGHSLSDAGDVNGDGLDDLIVGAPSAGGYQSGASDGRSGSDSATVTVEFAQDALSLAGLDGTNGFRLDGTAPNDWSGYSVSAAGDVNGDGIDDVIVGAPQADTAAGDHAGVSYVVFGTDTGFAANLDLAALDGSDGFHLDGAGYSVSAAGDVNGDGFDDLIVGNPFAADWAGASYVVFGTDVGFPASLDLAALDGRDGFRLDGAAGEFSGESVSAAGDVNGDGIGDLIVGAPRAGSYYTGASYVVFGSDAGFAATFDLAALDGSDGFRLEGAAAIDQTGESVSAGDVNGDGFDDLLIGAPGVNGGAGASYVVFGTDAGFAASFDLAALDGSDGFRLDAAANDSSAWSVSATGDFNGDGFDDLIVGAFRADIGGYDAGASYVVFGADAGFAASLDLAALDGSEGFRLDGREINDWSGFSVSAAGDFNGDGFDDLIIGAPGADAAGGYDAGASYVVFGTDVGLPASLDLAALDGSDGFRLDGAPNDHSGYSVSAAGDLNGDGLDDLIIGARDAGYSAGASYVVFGFRTDETNTTEASVAASPDDAEQVGARVNLASKDLDIGCTFVGLRFTGLEVPAGATITGAHIEFQARVTGGGAAEITIAAENTTDAASFSGRNDIAHRDCLDETTAWAPETWVKGETYSTADLGATLATLVGTGGIEADEALAFRFSGTGERTAWSYDGQGEAPRLVIDYEIADGSSEAPIETTAVLSPDPDPPSAGSLADWGEPALA